MTPPRLSDNLRGIALKQKRPRVPFIIAFLVLLCGLVPPRTALCAALERGTAIIDPLALRELEQTSFGLRHMIAPAPSSGAPIGNDALFALPSMAPVRKALDEEFDRYVAKRKAGDPN